MNPLPPHILALPTPRTNVFSGNINSQRLFWSVAYHKALDELRQLEREQLYMMEVLNLAMEVVITFEHKHTKGVAALAAYNNLKQYMEQKR